MANFVKTKKEKTCQISHKLLPIKQITLILTFCYQWTCILRSLNQKQRNRTWDRGSECRSRRAICRWNRRSCRDKAPAAKDKARSRSPSRWADRNRLSSSSNEGSVATTKDAANPLKPQYPIIIKKRVNFWNWVLVFENKNGNFGWVSYLVSYEEVEGGEEGEEVRGGGAEGCAGGGGGADGGDVELGHDGGDQRRR